MRLGRYLVGPRVGSGGTASVYLARLADDPEQLVALKIVHEHLSEEKEFIHQFLDEANLLLRLSHPNIVSVYELAREEQMLFLAIEYLDGEPLSKLFSSLRRQNLHLDPDLLAWIGARVAEGLGYAHKMTDEEGNSLGLVHRDISPQNVFITVDGRVKLIDFGIARAAGRIAQTTIGKIKGKFSYMAPEQVLSSEFDHRVDLFALGATLYEGAVGSRLFGGADETDTLHKLLFEEVPDPRTRVPDFPDELARILKHALEGKPEERYSDGGEMARDLDAFLASRGVSNAPERLAELMQSLFAAEREKRATAILELKQTTETLRPSGIAVKQAPRRWPWLAAAFAAALVVGLALLVRPTSSPTITSASAPPAATTVTFEVSLDPPVPAEIRVAGRTVTGNPARASLAKNRQGGDDQRDRRRLPTCPLDPSGRPRPHVDGAAGQRGKDCEPAALRQRVRPSHPGATEGDGDGWAGHGLSLLTPRWEQERRGATLSAMRIGSVALVALALVAGSATRAGAQTPSCSDTPAKCGKIAFDAGVKAYKGGDFETARARFGEAYEYKAHPVVLFNLALAESKSGHYIEAREHFASVVADDKTPKKLVSKAEAERDRAERNIARVEIEAAGKSVMASVDGTPMTGNPPTAQLNPGSHDVRVVVDGKEAVRRTVELGPGERLTVTVSHSRELVVSPTPAKPSRPDKGTPSRGISPVWFYVGAGATAVLGGVTVWSALDTQKAFDDYESELPTLSQTEVDQRVSNGHGKERRTNVLIAASAVAAVATTAVGVLLVDWKSGKTSAGLRVSPAGASLSGRF